MLRLNDFDFYTPETLDEALAILRDNPDCQVMAGGTDMVPKLKRGQFTPAAVLSLAHLKGLDEIRTDKDGLKIGALAKLRSLEQHGDVKALGAVYAAVRQIATPIIRNNATVGGNLLQDTRCRYYDRSLFWREAVGYCLKKSGDECKVAPGGTKCYAVLCSDLAAALAVLDAKATLAGKKRRTVAVEDLYTDDGAAYLDMEREVLVEVVVPPTPYRSTYKKLRMRGGFDFPEIGVAVAVRDTGSALALNIAVTAVGPGIFTLKEQVDRADLPDIVERVYRTIKPMDALYLPPAYRKTVAKRLLQKCLDELL